MLSNQDALNQTVSAAPATDKQKIVAANSTIMFLLAYLLCYLATQLATVAAAFSARIPTVLFPGHIEFNIADSAWRSSDVVSVYSAGPALAFAFAFVSGIIFLLVRKKRGLQKTFFLWTFLHGCNLFFGALVAGTLTKSGFWFALRWSGLPDTGVWIAAFLSIAILPVIGLLAAPAFLFSCDSISLMEFQNRKKMLNATVIAPWLIGSLCILLLKFPDLQFLETYQYFTLLLMLLPVYFLNQQNLFSETVEMPKKTRLAQTALVMLIVFGIAFRLALQNGRFFG